MGVLLAVSHDVEEGLERRHGHVGAAVRDVHLRHLLVRDAVSALSYSCKRLLLPDHTILRPH